MSATVQTKVAEPFALPNPLESMSDAYDALHDFEAQVGESSRELIAAASEFVARGCRTGAWLDAPRDRRAAQSMLDYWSGHLVRAGQPEPEARLAPFEEALAPEIPETWCPYMGLQAFQERDAAHFFGRQRLIDEMLAVLRSRRLLAVVGSSGSGKSSAVMSGLLGVLRAGALPDLAQPQVLTLVPGAKPLDNLARALHKLAAEISHGQISSEHAMLLSTAEQALAENPCALSELLDVLGARSVVAVVDQFEEAFTLCRDAASRGMFVDQLLNLAAQADANHSRVILTMRTDFEDRVAKVPELLAAFESGRVYAGPLGFNELRAAIEGPAAQVGLKFDDGIVEDMANTILGEKAGLPLLQFTLLKLWEQRKRNRITAQVYEQVGNPRQALQRSADAFYNALQPQQQDAVRRVFLRLAVPDENLEFTSQRVPRDELFQNNVARDRVIDALDKLEAARLIKRSAPNTPDEQIEVAHEALIRNWPKLAGWLEDSRSALRQRQRWRDDAARWRQTHDAGLLLRGEPLHNAESESAELDLQTQAFVQASRAAMEAEEREHEAAHERELVQARELAAAQSKAARRLRVLLVVSLVAALLALGLAGVATNAQQRAARNELAAKAAQATAEAGKTEIERLQTIIRSRELAAVAQTQIDKNAERSLLIAIEALRTSSTYEAEAALRAAVERPLARAVLIGHDNWVRSAQFSPDGRQIVTASDDGTARIWDAETGALTRILKGHTGIVWSAQFSPDGKQIVTASQDKTARVWDMSSGKQIALLGGHAASVGDAQFSPDGRWIVTASADQTARVWDAVTAGQIALLSGHEDEINSVQFSPDGRQIVTVSKDNTARVWDTASGKPIALLTGHEASVNSAQFSPDGKQIVTASDDDTARVWDALTGRQIMLLSGHEDVVSGARFSPDGRQIVTSSYDHTVRVWDAVSGEQTALLSGHVNWVSSAVFSPDGKQIVTASDDNTARVWDAETGEQVALLSGHQEADVNSAVFSPDGKRIVTASDDNTARVWDVASDRQAALLKGHTGVLSGVAFSPDGRQIVTASEDKTAVVWDAASGKQIALLSGHEADINGAQFSPDGKTVVTASDDKTARVWDAASGKQIAVLSGHEDWVRRAHFSPGGQWIVTAGKDNTARVWDVASGKQIALLSGHTGRLRNAQFSPDGMHIVTASDDGTARVWDAASGKQTALLSGHEDIVWNAQFSPDGKQVLTASEDKTARLWDAVSGKQIVLLSGHTAAVFDAQFSPDGKLIVTASADATARVWDTTSGQQSAVMRGHEDWIRSAQFSPDGRQIVTASDDYTARLWDVASGKQTAVLNGHEGAVNSAQFSPDGRRVVTASDDATARLFWAHVEDALIEAKSRVPRNRVLSCQERVQYLNEPLVCP